MINWGVIGAGGIAYRRTIPEGFMNAKNSRLTAIYDLDIKLAKKISSEFDVKAHETVQDLLDDKTIDVVYIATPVHLHHEQCILAAKHKKHVFCEKNLALNEKQCIEIIESAKINNIKLGVGYMMRFNSQHLEIRSAIQENRLGQVVMGRAQLSCWYPPMQGAWRQYKKLGGGGSLADMGSHCLDVLEFIFGSKIKEIYCMVGNLLHDYEVEDTALAICKFENGAFGFVDNCFNVPDRSSKNILEIYGSKGSIICTGTIGQDSNGHSEIIIEPEQAGYDSSQKRSAKIAVNKLKAKEKNIYQSEIEYFAECIEKNIKPEISGELGLHHVKLIEACYKSAKTGKTIKIN
jgi:predicted dehydrogenase